MNRLLRFAVFLSLVFTFGLAAAQTVRYAGSDPTSFDTVNVGQGTIETRSLGVASALDASQITALTVSGPGFTLVGGTCAPGVVVTASSNCTVQIRFAPGTVGPASGNLFVNCITNGAIGGVTILCGSEGGSIGLIGNALAAIAAVPAVSSTGLTVLSLLLLGAMLFTLRRQRRG